MRDPTTGIWSSSTPASRKRISFRWSFSSCRLVSGAKRSSLMTRAARSTWLEKSRPVPASDNALTRQTTPRRYSFCLMLREIRSVMANPWSGRRLLDGVPFRLPLGDAAAQPVHLLVARIDGRLRGLEALPALGAIAVEDHRRVLVARQLRQVETVFLGIELHV